jgi:hypothetical protein
MLFDAARCRSAGHRPAAQAPRIPAVRRRVIVLAAIVAALGSCPASASAGSYRVYSCVAPSGGAAPIGDGSYGWQPSARAGTTSLSLANAEAGAVSNVTRTTVRQRSTFLEVPLWRGVPIPPLEVELRA